jgi:endonuclease/exonuclease/phosphatase family metal-dependent hydrolase
MADLRFTVGQMLAIGRIGLDLCHSLLRPLAVPPGPLPERRSRPGESAGDAARSRKDNQHLKVASWNIHRCYHIGELQQSLRTFLSSEDPDIVLLQEAPVFQEAPFWDHELFSELLSRYHLEYVVMHRVSRPSSYYSFSETGLVTLSKMAPIAVEAVPLPTVSRRKLGRNHIIRRVALVTRHAWADRVVCICHLHLENTTGPQGRALQISHLLDQLDQPTSPISILAGDFNTLFGGREKVDDQVAAQGFVPVPIAGRPRLLPALDHFFVSGCTGLTGRTLDLSGSDHRPIIFELEPAAITGLADSL